MEEKTYRIKMNKNNRISKGYYVIHHLMEVIGIQREIMRLINLEIAICVIKQLIISKSNIIHTFKNLRHQSISQ